VTKKAIANNKNISNNNNLDPHSNNVDSSTNSTSAQINEIKNSIAKLEKIVENNSIRINTIASLLEKFLNENE